MMMTMVLLVINDNSMIKVIMIIIINENNDINKNINDINDEMMIMIMNNEIMKMTMTILMKW